MKRFEAQGIFDLLRTMFAWQYPDVLGARLSFAKKHFDPHPERRDLAWCDLDTRHVFLLERALREGRSHVTALIAHELGHLSDPMPDAPRAEHRADRIARSVLGQRILYDEHGIQNLSRGGARPRRLKA